MWDQGRWLLGRCELKHGLKNLEGGCEKMDQKKRIIGIGIIALVIFGLFASSILVIQASRYKVEIRVKGTPGIPFSGDYGDFGTLKSVNGTVPETYTYTIESPDGDIVGGTFQKQGKSGELIVELVIGGKVVKTESTTAEYGAVSVYYSI